MTREEILDEYEALWRQAAMEDAQQTNVDEHAPGPWRSCAWLIAATFNRDDLVKAANELDIPWQPWGGTKRSLSGLMATLNNQHHWTWDMFANKFRDALAQGETS